MTLVGMDVDPSESAEHIRSWAERNGFDWPLVRADAEAISAYRVTSQTTAFGIDPSGTIIFRKNPGRSDEGAWLERLESLAVTNTSVASGATAAAVTDGVASAVATSVADASSTSPLTVSPTPFALPVPSATLIPVPTAAAQDDPPPTPERIATAIPPIPPFPDLTPPTATPTPRPAPTATPRPAPTATPAPTPTPSLPVGSNVGQRAPDFTVTAVDGTRYNLAEVNGQGQAVLFYFYATW